MQNPKLRYFKPFEFFDHTTSLLSGWSAARTFKWAISYTAANIATAPKQRPRIVRIMLLLSFVFHCLRLGIVSAPPGYTASGGGHTPSLSGCASRAPKPSEFDPCIGSFGLHGLAGGLIRGTELPRATGGRVCVGLSTTLRQLRRVPLVRVIRPQDSGERR